MTYTAQQLQMLVDYYWDRRDYPASAFSADQLAVRSMLMGRGLLPLDLMLRPLVRAVRSALQVWR